MEKSTLPGDNQAQKPPIGEVSGLLRAWGDGDRGARDTLTSSSMTNSTVSHVTA
jgi:hypothetical protein